MKKRFPLTLLFVVLLFYVDTIKASTEDSLLNVISNTEGTEKLEAIFNLNKIKHFEKDAINYFIMLEEEARKQNNEEYIEYALTSKASFYAHRGNSEKFYPAVEEAMAYLLERENLKLYFILYSTIVKMYLNDGYYETAFLKISSMLEDAKKFNYILGEILVYENMGDAYNVDKHFQKSLESYQKAYSLLNNYTIFPHQLFLKAESGFRIAQNAYDAGDMHLTILYCDSAMQSIEEYDKIKTVGTNALSTNYLNNVLYATLALAYISVGRENEAADAMNMAFKYAEDEVIESYNSHFNNFCSNYYFKKGEYKTALEYIEKNEALFELSTIPNGDVLLKKSKIFAAMGDFESAYKFKQEYEELTDSLNQKKLSQRISELRTIHEVEKLESQTEQERLRAVNLRQFILGLAVIVFLLVCVILIIINNLNKTKHKNRVLYQRIQSQEAVELELIRKEEALHSKLSFDGIITDEEAGQLYIRLKELMKEKENYTDSNITRKSIAIKLGTNETYLYETIKKCLDMSFTEYVNLLRLDYAKEKMEKHFNKFTIEDIAMMSGFGTRQTFHRLFRDRYGLSPSEYSKMLKNT